jgi:hypothetical protein
MHETRQEHQRNEDLRAKRMSHTQGGDAQREQYNLGL